MSRSSLLFYAVVRGVLVAFCRTFWRLKVEGLDRVPAEEPFVLAPVHRSNVDTPLVAAVTRRRLRYMGKASMWKYRWSAWLFTALGGFPVHRGSADREALRRCLEVLHAGEPVVVFPEGTRRSGPVVEELFDGAAYLAVRAGVPIVPVGIGGSEQAMPKGARFLRPVRCHLVIGEPLRPKPAEEGSRAAARRGVHELTAELRAELQRLFDAAQSAAGTPNPPAKEDP